MEQRTVHFDSDLLVEAYQFKGIKQEFPNHFHEFYVVGFIEKGCRFLSCNHKEYHVDKNDLLLINPYDNHFCRQIGTEALDYRSIHINPERMKRLSEVIIGKDRLPVFRENVIPNYTGVQELKKLHQLISTKEDSLEKETYFTLFLEDILKQYADYGLTEPVNILGIDQLCSYIEAHYAEKLSLELLSQLSHMNQFTLIRHFTKVKGVTPHQYLTTIRVGEAKKLLEQGAAPIEVALNTGFSDQSHFSRKFKNLIGVTPKQYQAIFQSEVFDDSFKK